MRTIQVDSLSASGMKASGPNCFNNVSAWMQTLVASLKRVIPGIRSLRPFEEGLLGIGGLANYVYGPIEPSEIPEVPPYPKSPSQVSK